MVEAMKDCCDNVWAIVEITGPDEGFDCNLLLDTGGTQFRSPNPKNDPNPNYSGSYPDLSEKVEVRNDDSNRADNSGRLNSLLAFGAKSNGIAVDNIWRSSVPGSSPSDEIGQNRSESGSDEGEQDILNVVELRALMGLGPSVTVRMLPSAIPDTRNFE
jgi:hypothetical protein